VSVIDKISLSEKNHKRIMDTIRINGQISAAQLARINDLQPSTVHYILQHLKNHDLIEVARQGESTQAGGKPPVLWQLVKDTGYTLGLEVLKKKIRYVIIDFAGNAIGSGEHEIQPANTMYTVAENCRALLTDILMRYRLSKNKAIGIGIGITGLVDSTATSILYSRELETTNYELSTVLSKRMGMPVTLINDANAGVLGYNWYNNGQSTNSGHYVYLTINTDAMNIGCGILIGGALYTGYHGIAGETSTPLPNLNQLLNEGIKRSGGHDPLVEKYKHTGLLSMDHVLAYRNEVSSVASFIIDTITAAIVNEMVIITGFFDPCGFIIGGNITEMKVLIDEYIRPRLAQLCNKAIPVENMVPQVIVSPFGKYSVAYGATAVINMKIFN